MTQAQLITVSFVFGYFFRWAAQQLSKALLIRNMKNGSRRLPSLENPPPPTPKRKTDDATPAVELVKVAAGIDWSQFVGVSVIASFDGGGSWVIRDKSGKFATVSVSDIQATVSVSEAPKPTTDATND